MKDFVTANGIVAESLSNDRYKVKLDNGVTITAYPSGKIRVRKIRILVGDRVTVEISPYDLTNGRIARRL